MDERAIAPENGVVRDLRMLPRPFRETYEPPKKNWLRRLYVTLRRLVRRRQESAVVMALRKKFESELIDVYADADKKCRAADRKISAAEKAFKLETVKLTAAFEKEVTILGKRIANRDTALDEMRQKMARQQADFDYATAQKTSDIKELHDVEIPKLKRELSVANTHIEYLEKVIERMHVHEERQIAVDNQRIVDAENPSNELHSRQILRGEA